MHGGSGRKEKSGAEASALDNADLEALRGRVVVAFFGSRAFGYDRHVADELAASAKVAGDGDALEFRARGFQRCGGVLQQCRCAMDMQPAGAASRDREVLQDLRLQRRPEAFGLPD